MPLAYGDAIVETMGEMVHGHRVTTTTTRTPTSKTTTRTTTSPTYVTVKTTTTTTTSTMTTLVTITSPTAGITTTAVTSGRCKDVTDIDEEAAGTTEVTDHEAAVVAGQSSEVCLIESF